MKKLFYIAWLCLTFAACSREELPELSGGNPASLTLSINTMQNDVKTRAASPDPAERRIFNLYVFVFNANGSVDHQQFYSFPSILSVKVLTIDELTCGSGKSVAVIANIDSKNTILKLEATKLDAITLRSELDALIVTMQNQSIERGTNFMTSGITENITISADAATNATVLLKRVDAKIRFNITTKEGVTFTPSEWRIVSAPQNICVMGSYPDLCSDKSACFDTDWAQYEDGGATFVFYTMEHIPTPRAQIPNQGSNVEQYALREKQDKTSTGSGNSVINGVFTYAPAMATYVEMCGNISYIGPAGVEISADVVYTVHLGGVEGVNDYNTLRNTFYTYNVKIMSVNSIGIEVDSSDAEEENEQRPGGEGNITAAREILNLDSYNEIRLLEFNQSDVEPHLTWSVSTPFSMGSEAENPSDYKWVYFRINTKNQAGTRYNNTYQTYLGDQSIYAEEVTLATYMADIAAGKDKLIDVKQLVSLLKESKSQLLLGRSNLFDLDNNIKITAFVNEYYYETSMDGSSTQTEDLWKQFANQQPRVMNLLSNLKYSPDHESSRSNTVYSIRQHAIQTMYNRKLDETYTAWGTQTLQDDRPIVFDKNSFSASNNANDNSNGRKNTIQMWELPKSWSYYITQDTWSMNTNYDAAKYKCLRMNRDNNGDGKIDESEVQWYLAAINQLTDIWIGEWSYDQTARLYKNPTWQEQYFVSSTAQTPYNNKDNPDILWSSEGSSVGVLSKIEVNGNQVNHVNTPVYYRCVRNLGIPRNANIDTKPHELATYDQTTHRISLKWLDAQSIRGYYQENEELPVHHEREAANKPYWEFEVSTTVVGGNSYTWQSLFNQIQSGIRLCPEGYRIPNQRELALMYSRIGNDGNWTLDNHFSRTSFQFDTGRPGFAVTKNSAILHLLHQNRESGGVRCVKDYVQNR